MSQSLQPIHQFAGCLILYLLSIFQPIWGGPPIWNAAKTSIPTPLSTFVSGVYQNNIYLIGGVIDEFGVTPNPYIYQLNLTETSLSDIIDNDLTNDDEIWSSFQESPPNSICCFDTQHKGALSMYSQGSSYTDNLLFIVPYVSNPSDKPSILLIFDMDRKSFRSPQNYDHELPISLSDPCVVSTSSFVYIIGGVYYEPPSFVDWKNTLQIYDINNDRWSPGPSLNTKRRSAACNILDNTLYVFGGRGELGDLDTIERYKLFDQDSQGWKQLKDVQLLKMDEELRYFISFKKMQRF